MKLPKRPETHVIEAESWRLLQSLAPQEWIVREVTERDYGIDCYIELASPDGYITGDLISVQLKGESEVEWKSANGGKHKARSPSIKTSTANYWLRLPVPVFLFVADLSKGDIFYASVEESLRSDFRKLGKQDSVSFALHSDLSLKSSEGIKLLRWLYARERLHEQFSFHITNLISQIDMFTNFILEHQNRDIFLPVETEDHLQFRALHESCHMASIYLGNEWKIESLSELYEKDKREWKDEFYDLHEGTLDCVLQEIEKTFPGLIRNAIKLVTETQGAYWNHKDPVFFNLCSSGELGWALERLEGEAK